MKRRGQATPAAILVERAPAKVNLTLRVLGRRADGYHELESLIGFAGVADTLMLEPGPDLDIRVAGPTAAASGAIDDNLVLRASRRLADLVPGLALGRFRLVKRLPVAAGLGGGSSDAAAALRLLARANGIALDDPRLAEAALAVGSDVPVCLQPVARVMGGRGEKLGAPLRLRRLPAVLVNPGVAVPTAAVFRALGLAPAEQGPSAPLPARGADAAWAPETLFARLRSETNDLEPPARALAPEIAAVAAVLEERPGCRLVRMSGSGATVFALFDRRRAAAAAARALRSANPDWWVAATVLR